MTTTTATAPAKVTAPRVYRVTRVGVLRSELSKFLSLRSSWITLGLTMLFLVGFGILSAVRYNPSNPAGGHFGASAPGNAVAIALGGQNFAMLAVGVLGVLFMAGEYSTGMIRSTLTAVPRRLPVLWSKSAVLAITVFIVATAAVVIAFLGGESSLAGTKVALSLSSSGVIGALLGAGGYFALVAVLGVALFAVFRFPPLMQQRDLALFFLGCAPVAAIALGLAAKSRHAQLQALAERAARLEVEREQRTQLATAAERSRISREMHDIVGHNLAVITGLADGAARLASRQPADTAQTTRALELIADTSRQALSELRRTLGVLRDPDADQPSLTPQPGLAEIPRLIERVQNAGPRVTYTTDGDLTHFAPGLQLTVYRVIQEALTNILKHAQAATHVTVAVTRQEHTAAVTVRDDAPQRAGAQHEGESHGLLGLRERASLAGGTMTAGPGPERGWSVSAVLPIDTTQTP